MFVLTVAKRDIIDERLVYVTLTSGIHFSYIVCYSYTGAKQLAAAASSYIAASGTNTLYTSYFGTSLTSTVNAVFDRVVNESSTTRTYAIPTQLPLQSLKLL